MDNVKKKNIVLITLIVLVIIIALVIVVIFMLKKNNNNDMTFDVNGATVTFKSGNKITSSNLKPVAIKNEGLENGDIISKRITINSKKSLYLDLYMTIEKLPNELKKDSFKWEVFVGDSLINSGNFQNQNEGDKIKILSNQKINNTVEYDLYIWIDGNMLHNKEMENKLFDFKLEADTSEQMHQSLAYTTLTNLGLNVSEGYPNFKKSAQQTCFSDSKCENTNGIYAAEDDLGTSYYFRGFVENNYVKFAGYYWRIIRINGDGTIRMIYDGTSAHANGESSADRHVGSVKFNQNSKDNAYVGYMYGSTGSNKYEETHENINDSTIKTANDNWYKTNIEDKGYSQYVADAIYCNDRTLIKETETSVTDTFYGAFNREIFNTPTLKCPQNNDKFTVSDTLGNGNLTYPVGLITADEVMYAGGTELNSSYYLFIEDCFWTMTPSNYFHSTGSTGAAPYYVMTYGKISNSYSYDDYMLRPVISLKSDLSFSGNGTMDSPFEIA